MPARPPHDPLFALALARAEAYLERARPPAEVSPEAIRRALEPWALRTRFASRIDLDELARALCERALAAGRAARAEPEPDGGDPGSGRG